MTEAYWVQLFADTHPYTTRGDRLWLASALFWFDGGIL
jgi:hypothetical protein